MQGFLGYAANGNNLGGTLSIGHAMHTANIALLGNYLASTFVAASDGHGGTRGYRFPHARRHRAPSSPVAHMKQLIRLRA